MKLTSLSYVHSVLQAKTNKETDEMKITYPLIRTFLGTIQNSNPLWLRFEGTFIFKEIPNLKFEVQRTVSTMEDKIKV